MKLTDIKEMAFKAGTWNFPIDSMGFFIDCGFGNAYFNMFETV